MIRDALTVLSYGGGQDSTAILIKLIHDPKFRAKYAPEKLIVVMSDTGNEHNETYEYVAMVKGICADAGIPFYFLNSEWSDLVKRETGTPLFVDSWSGGLIGHYRRNTTVGSKRYVKSCTEQLKIKPIYKFLEYYLSEKYGIAYEGRKKGFRKYAEKYGRMRVLLGIAKAEEKRVAKASNSGPKWMQRYVERVYPLIDEGMDRKACQEYIASQGYKVPVPSNCILCPFMDKRELLLLYRESRRWYETWVNLEQNRLDKASGGEVVKGKSVSVWGSKKLPEILEEAQKEFGHMTTEELRNYRFSHGHCVKSAY